MRKHAQDAYFILRDFPIVELHPESERVAVAARCVYEQHNQDRYWQYHDRLFASQERHTPDDLKAYAAPLRALLQSRRLESFFRRRPDFSQDCKLQFRMEYFRFEEYFQLDAARFFRW